MSIWFKQLYMEQLTLVNFGVQELGVEEMYQNNGGFGMEVISEKSIHEWGDFAKGFLDGLFN